MTTVLGLCLYLMAPCHGYPPTLAQLQMLSSSLGLFKNTQHCVEALPVPLSGVTAFTAKDKQSSPGEWTLKRDLGTGKKNTYSKNSGQRCWGAGVENPLTGEIWLTVTCFYTHLLCR